MQEKPALYNTSNNTNPDSTLELDSLSSSQDNSSDPLLFDIEELSSKSFLGLFTFAIPINAHQSVLDRFPYCNELCCVAAYFYFALRWNLFHYDDPLLDDWPIRKGKSYTPSNAHHNIFYIFNFVGQH